MPKTNDHENNAVFYKDILSKLGVSIDVGGILGMGFDTELDLLREISKVVCKHHNQKVSRLVDMMEVCNESKA